jgi:hypothetical protein
MERHPFSQTHARTHTHTYKYTHTYLAPSLAKRGTPQAGGRADVAPPHTHAHTYKRTHTYTNTKKHTRTWHQVWQKERHHREGGMLTSLRP